MAESYINFSTCKYISKENASRYMSLSFHRQKFAKYLLNDEFSAGAGAENFEFEAIPDVAVDGLDLRLCRIRIYRVGEALPCVQFADPKSKEVYSKTEDTKVYDDYGKIEIGNICPVNYPYGKKSSNQLTAQVVYEVPPGSGLGELAGECNSLHQPSIVGIRKLLIDN